jgi:hypothetical protein
MRILFVHHNFPGQFVHLAADAEEPAALAQPCPCCGGHMIIIERFERGSTPRYRPSAPTPAIRIDTS